MQRTRLNMLFRTLFSSTKFGLVLTELRQLAHHVHKHAFCGVFLGFTYVSGPVTLFLLGVTDSNLVQRMRLNMVFQAPISST